MFKKIITIVLALTLCFALAACGKSNTETNENVIDTEVTDNTSVSDSEDDDEVIKITMPAFLYESVTNEEIIYIAQEAGYSSCLINEDGSVTYTLTKAKYNELIDNFSNEIDEYISMYLDGENAVESFQNITYNKDYTEFDFLVDSNTFSDEDTAYSFVFYTCGISYQAFTGIDTDKIEVTIKFIDISDNKSIEEFVVTSNNYSSFAGGD